MPVSSLNALLASLSLQLPWDCSLFLGYTSSGRTWAKRAEACPTHSLARIVADVPASTIAEYLAALPADRRAAITAVRKVINDNLPNGYEEGLQFGMIGWYVPLSAYPAGYGDNKKVPLPLISLASQKSGMVLHCIALYMNPALSTWFTSEYKKSGKKLEMGKGCVRFNKLDDLAVDVVGRLVARLPVKEHIASYQAARAVTGKGKGNSTKGDKKSTVKKATGKKSAK